MKKQKAVRRARDVLKNPPSVPPRWLVEDKPAEYPGPAECPAGIPPVEMVDRAAWEVMQRLAQSGILQFANAPARILHRAGGDAEPDFVELTIRAA
ncbi:MAG TPA: hypothetical protein VFT69_13390 [Pseudolabrys sp.]|nr:hypothetical protein [Pseudolabrys sp.]